MSCWREGISSGNDLGDIGGGMGEVGGETRVKRGNEKAGLVEVRAYSPFISSNGNYCVPNRVTEIDDNDYFL